MFHSSVPLLPRAKTALIPTIGFVVAIGWTPMTHAQVDLFSWTSATSQGGSVTVGTDKITIVGPDGGFCVGGASTSVTAIAPVAGILRVKFDFFTQDSPLADAAFFRVGAQQFPIGQCYGCDVVFAIPAGATFGFGVESTDCLQGAGTATLEDLRLLAPPSSIAMSPSSAGEETGNALTSVGDINGDGIRDVVVGAAKVNFNAGRVSLHSGADGSLIWSTNGAAQSELGFTVASIPDMNGDGKEDLLAGAPTGQAGIGGIFILSGADGSPIQSLLGTTSGDRFGAALSSIDDINGDGLPDLLVGAPLFDAPGIGVDSGMVRAFSGATGALLYTKGGSAAGDEFGRSIATLTDISGDGIPDWMAGAPLADGSTTDVGAIQFCSGSTGATLATLAGITTGGGFGSACANAGDVNGDGYTDVIIGAPDETFAGNPLSGVARVYSTRNGDLLHLFSANFAEHIGASVDGGADVDGDGFDDLVVGQRSGLAWQPGLARVYSGKSGTLLTVHRGSAPGDHFGATVRFAGDVDGDDLPDLLIGAPLDDTAGTDAGLSALYSDRLHWAGLGLGLPGSAGVPLFHGEGVTIPTTPVTLSLSNALPNAFAPLVVGLSRLDAPFMGGLLIPSPDVILIGSLSDSTGSVTTTLPWPAGIPSATEVFLQYWIADASGPVGFTASNGLRALVQ